MQLEQKRARAKSNDRGEFAVRGAAFLNIDRGREMILPGAYSKHLNKFVDRGKILADHDNKTKSLAGSITTAFETDRGLVVKGKFASSKQGQDVRTMAQEGVLKDVSIGHYVHEYRDGVKADEVQKIWAKFNYTPSDDDLRAIKRGPVRVLVECEPVEVSFVGIPMNPEARILEVKSMPEQKRGAVLNRVNATTLKQVYKLVKQMLAGARQDLEETSGAVPTADSAAVASESKRVDPPDFKSNAERLRLELALLDLETA